MTKRIYTAVIVVLVMFFIGGIVMGLWNITMSEGVFLPKEAPKESLSPVPETREDIISYLNLATSSAIAAKPKLEKVIEYWIPDEGGVSFSVESPLLDTSVVYMKNKITSTLNSKVDKEGNILDFGEDMSSLFKAPLLDTNSFDISFTYKELNEETNEETWFNDNRIKVEFHTQEKPVDSRSALALNFNLSETELEDVFADAFSAYFKLDSYTVSYENCRINASVNRFTDKLEYITFVKSTKATMQITPVGALEPLGQMTCTLVFEEYNKYIFTWPSIKLDHNSFSMEKGKTKNLLAYITADSDVKATWSSSDESIVSVDQDGYLKSHKLGDATITASIDFQGQTFTDTCLVSVKKSVDGVRLNKHKLNLEQGETSTLKTKVTPKKATIKTYHWYSEDESIATVDDTGLITAISPGETKVYVLTDDGSYRSSCKVFVK